jgi:hypothetical protein
MTVQIPWWSGNLNAQKLLRANDPFHANAFSKSADLFVIEPVGNVGSAAIRSVFAMRNCLFHSWFVHSVWFVHRVAVVGVLWGLWRCVGLGCSRYGSVRWGCASFAA